MAAFRYAVSGSNNYAVAGSYSKGPVTKGIVDDNCMGLDLDICPDLLLAGIAAAAAGFFAALFTAITMAGRKKKRSIDDASGRPAIGFDKVIADFYWHGTNRDICTYRKL